MDVSWHINGRDPQGFQLRILTLCKAACFQLAPRFSASRFFDDLAAHGATVSQVCLAWLLARSPVMLPIPGTSSSAHLSENMAGADLELTDDEMAALDGQRRSLRRWMMQA